MADAGANRLRRFRWKIKNLFVPRLPLIATFYIETPTLTSWRVTFIPRARGYDSWPFSLYLRNVRFGEDDDSPLEAQMRVIISANGNELANRPEPHFSFSPANQFRYELPGNLPTIEVSYNVTIEIQLSFPHRNNRNPRNELDYNITHMLLLQRNMDSLRSNRRYSNLTLISRDHIATERVHSYIIRARWSNFFSVHPRREIVDNTVEFSIPGPCLEKLIEYLYTARLYDDVLDNPQFKTELLRVIDRYKIQHLYKLYVVHDSRQRRRTTKDLRTHVTSFPLDGPPWGDRTFSWTVNPQGVYQFSIRIQFSFSCRPPSFSYVLHSAPTYICFAHVKLELQSRPEGAASTFHTVHMRHYMPTGMIRSGDSHFEGIEQPVLDEFLNGIHRRGRSRRRIEHFFRVTIHRSNGSSVTRIRSEGHHETLLLRDRLKILCDHMYGLLMNPTETDFQLSCPAEDQNDPYVLFDLHRSIFTTRVPRWRDVLENAQEWDDLHATATCITSSEAFRFIAAYLYSGKMFPISTRYLGDVLDFAERGEIIPLANFVRASLEDLPERRL